QDDEAAAPRGRHYPRPPARRQTDSARMCNQGARTVSGGVGSQWAQLVTTAANFCHQRRGSIGWPHGRVGLSRRGPWWRTRADRLRNACVCVGAQCNVTAQKVGLVRAHLVPEGWPFFFVSGFGRTGFGSSAEIRDYARASPDTELGEERVATLD